MCLGVEKIRQRLRRRPVVVPETLHPVLRTQRAESDRLYDRCGLFPHEVSSVRRLSAYDTCKWCEDRIVEHATDSDPAFSQLFRTRYIELRFGV